MNSLRVLWFVLKPPRIDEVTIDEPCFWTPRIIMQKWEPSITTATPWGSRTSMIASAI